MRNIQNICRTKKEKPKTKGLDRIGSGVESWEVNTWG